MKRKFYLMMHNFLGLAWQHDFEESSVSGAQDYARVVCKKLPVGCAVTLYMPYGKDQMHCWGEWERTNAPVIDDFAKQEKTIEERIKVFTELEAQLSGSGNGASNGDGRPS